MDCKAFLAALLATSAIVTAGSLTIALDQGSEKRNLINANLGHNNIKEPLILNNSSQSQGPEFVKEVNNSILERIGEKVVIDHGPLQMRRQKDPNGCGLAVMQCMYTQEAHRREVTQEECFEAIMGLKHARAEMLTDEEIMNIEDPIEKNAAIRRNHHLKEREEKVDGMRAWSANELVEGFYRLNGENAKHVLVHFYSKPTPAEFYYILINQLRAANGPLVYRKGNHWIVIDKIDMENDKIRVYNSLYEENEGQCAPKEQSLYEFYSQAMIRARFGRIYSWDMVRFRTPDEDEFEAIIPQ